MSQISVPSKLITVCPPTDLLAAVVLQLCCNFSINCIFNEVESCQQPANVSFFVAVILQLCVLL